MAHDKSLLIKLMVMDRDESEQTRLSKTTQALREILKLHKPYMVNDVFLCDVEPLEYPCPTIQAIERNL